MIGTPGLAAVEERRTTAKRILGPSGRAWRSGTSSQPFSASTRVPEAAANVNFSHAIRGEVCERAVMAVLQTTMKAKTILDI
jgi:hypothetical protein